MVDSHCRRPTLPADVTRADSTACACPAPTRNCRRRTADSGVARADSARSRRLRLPTIARAQSSRRRVPRTDSSHRWPFGLDSKTRTADSNRGRCSRGLWPPGGLWPRLEPLTVSQRRLRLPAVPRSALPPKATGLGLVGARRCSGRAVIRGAAPRALSAAHPDGITAQSAPCATLGGGGPFINNDVRGRAAPPQPRVTAAMLSGSAGRSQRGLRQPLWR